MATNSTAHYHFPLFAGNDKPSILTDWNGTVEDLDEILADFEGRIESNTQITQGFNDQVLALRRAFEELEMKVEGDESTISENTTNIFLLREQLLTFGAKVKEHTISIDALETEVDSIQDAISDLDNIRAMAEAGSQASTIAYNNRNCLSSGLANQLFIPALPVAVGDYVYGHRVNEDTHQDQPVEGALYKCIQNHTGDWNSAHFERAEGVLKDLDETSTAANELAEHVDDRCDRISHDLNVLEGKTPGVVYPDYGKMCYLASIGTNKDYDWCYGADNRYTITQTSIKFKTNKPNFKGALFTNGYSENNYFCLGLGEIAIAGDHRDEFNRTYPARIQVLNSLETETLLDQGNCIIEVYSKYYSSNTTHIRFRVFMSDVPTPDYLDFSKLRKNQKTGVPFTLFDYVPYGFVYLIAADFINLLHTLSVANTDVVSLGLDSVPHELYTTRTDYSTTPPTIVYDKVSDVGVYDVSAAYPNS